MIWKTFLVSFILNSSRHKKLFLLDSTFTSSIPEKIQRRSRSYSDDLDSGSNGTNFTFTKTTNTFFSKPGHDNTYNGSDNDTDIILNITRFYRQMELLKSLENKNVSRQTKLKLVENYEKQENQTPLLPNIFSGGLYNDWNYDIEK
jgi:hypothetical protein